jgi:hypothetical protein
MILLMRGLMARGKLCLLFELEEIIMFLHKRAAQKGASNQTRE